MTDWQIDSAFQLTEHLKALHYSHTHPRESDSIQPITADIAKQLATPPPNTSKDIWLYELGRFLIQKTNAIIVALFADSPPCSVQTCPEMRASEWQYLCAVHDPPKSCAAIDYCCHTLDWAATTLTSSKMFPSRLGLGSGSGVTQSNDKVLTQQMKEIKNIYRRVYRIYAHAWFQHRDMFWRVEAKTGLYVFFKMVCDEYGIIESENYTIPAEAEGLEPETVQAREEVQAPSVLKRDQDAGTDFDRMMSDAKEPKASEHEPAGNNVLSMGDTTKRHRHTMTEFSSSVNTVIQEEAEEEDRAEKDEEPTVATATTDVKDFEQQPVEAEDQVQDDDDAPVPRIVRSDTIKATREAEDAEADEGEQTVIETVTEVDADADDDSDTRVESTEVQDQPAKAGEDAGKSVGD